MAKAARGAKIRMISRPFPVLIFILPNVQDEPRPSLARSVRLGARSVTARVVGSSAWLGAVVWVV